MLANDAQEPSPYVAVLPAVAEPADDRCVQYQLHVAADPVERVRSIRSICSTSHSGSSFTSSDCHRCNIAATRRARSTLSASAATPWVGPWRGDDIFVSIVAHPPAVSAPPRTSWRRSPGSGAPQVESRMDGRSLVGMVGARLSSARLGSARLSLLSCLGLASLGGVWRRT